MTNQTSDRLSPVLYVPHGGGPLPVLGDDRHEKMVSFLKEIVKSLSLGGTYIINNPFAASTTNKILDIKLGSRLGLTTATASGKVAPNSW